MTVAQPEDAPGTISGWFARARENVRGGALIALSMPMLLEALIELGRGRLNQTAAAGGAFALMMLAVLRLRRDKGRRATVGAGVRVGFAAALVASFGAEYGPVMSTLIGLAAGYGTLLAYGPAKEAVLPDLPRPPVPSAPLPPPPPADPDAQALAGLDARITALAAAPLTLPRGEFARIVARVATLGDALLREARSDPADFVRVRRFLSVFLDQVETLTMRYRTAHPEGGALTPELAQVMADLERAFEEKLAELRAHDLKALDVEREVLAQRLSEQLSTPRLNASGPPPQEIPR